MRFFSILFVSLACVSAANAAFISTLAVNHQNASIPEKPATGQIPMQLSVFADGTQATFGVNATPADIGMTFDAPPATVAAFNNLVDSFGPANFSLAYQISDTFMFRDFNLNEADFWSGSSVLGWTVNTSVPKLGHNMSGYTIDSIQLTVEDFREQVTNMGAALQYDAAFTVRIFGRVPEPASISLIALGVASLLLSHRRRS